MTWHSSAFMVWIKPFMEKISELSIMIRQTLTYSRTCLIFQQQRWPRRQWPNGREQYRYLWSEQYYREPRRQWPCSHLKATPHRHTCVQDATSIFQSMNKSYLLKWNEFIYIKWKETTNQGPTTQWNLLQYGIKIIPTWWKTWCVMSIRIIKQSEIFLFFL